MSRAWYAFWIAGFSCMIVHECKISVAKFRAERETTVRTAKQVRGVSRSMAAQTPHCPCEHTVGIFTIFRYIPPMCSRKLTVQRPTTWMV